jgi:hypothetical protein
MTGIYTCQPFPKNKKSHYSVSRIVASTSVGFVESRYPLVGIMTIMLMLTRIPAAAITRSVELMFKLGFGFSIEALLSGCKYELITAFGALSIKFAQPIREAVQFTLYYNRSDDRTPERRE